MIPMDAFVSGSWHMIKDFKQYAGITPQGYERLITGTKISELEL